MLGLSLRLGFGLKAKIFGFGLCRGFKARVVGLAVPDLDLVFRDLVNTTGHK